MKSLLYLSSIRYQLRHRWQLALAILGIALGVAVVVAIDVATGSAQRSFELSTDAVIGKATHQVVGTSGQIPEEIYRQLRVDLSIISSAPVIEGEFTVDKNRDRVLTLLGIDPFAESRFRAHLGSRLGTGIDLSRFLLEPGAVLLERATAAELGIGLGQRFQIDLGDRRADLELIGHLTAEDDISRDAISDLAVVDIATAQEVLGLEGTLNRIDLVLPAGRTGDRHAADLQSKLPATVDIEPASARRETAGQMTRAFRLNLHALSLLALFCGAFLIYNTMTFAVVQRRQLLAVLRAIGTTRRQLLRIVLLEAALLGVVGSAIGLVVGVVLGRSLVGLVTQTINDLYYVVSVRSVALDAWTVWKGLLVGMGATLLAALAPAIEASSTEPRQALDRVELESKVHRLLPVVSLLGGVLLIVGLGVLWGSGEQIVPAFVGLFVFLMGAAALTPLFTVCLMALFTPLAARLLGQVGRLATRGVTATLSRTGIAVAALMMALAVTVGVDLMIRSFRSTVESWLAYSLPADLYITSFVSPARRFRSGPRFEPELLASVSRLRGVTAVNGLRHFEARLDDRPVRAMALSVAPPSRSAFTFIDQPPEIAWSLTDSGRGVMISEALAYRRGLSRGDPVVLSTPSGDISFEIAGVFYDYSSEQGILLISRDRYLELWSDASLTALSVHLEAAADSREVEGALLRLLGEQSTARVVSNTALREQSMRVFDRTFRITGVLRTLAVLVAFVGVLSSLMALQLERRREQGVLLAQGMTPGQLWRLISHQTGLIGLSAGLFSIPVGISIAAIMVTVINRRSFGWSLELQVAPSTLIQAVIVGVVAAFLAGLYPAVKMSRTSLADALRSE